MREGHVIVILQTPTDRAIAHTFLALLQLFQETKVSGHDWNEIYHSSWQPKRIYPRDQYAPR